eukprot:SAG31_NODE_281_length_18584_cov_10.762564_17_plen_363_part_00
MFDPDLTGWTARGLCPRTCNVDDPAGLLPQHKAVPQTCLELLHMPFSNTTVGLGALNLNRSVLSCGATDDLGEVFGSKRLSGWTARSLCGHTCSVAQIRSAAVRFADMTLPRLLSVNSANLELMLSDTVNSSDWLTLFADRHLPAVGVQPRWDAITVLESLEPVSVEEGRSACLCGSHGLFRRARYIPNWTHPTTCGAEFIRACNGLIPSAAANWVRRSCCYYGDSLLADVDVTEMVRTAIVDVNTYRKTGSDWQDASSGSGAKGSNLTFYLGEHPLLCGWVATALRNGPASACDPDTSQSVTVELDGQNRTFEPRRKCPLTCAVRGISMPTIQTGKLSCSYLTTALPVWPYNQAIAHLVES